jgi:hypothetical protein
LSTLVNLGTKDVSANLAIKAIAEESRRFSEAKDTWDKTVCHFVLPEVCKQAVHNDWRLLSSTGKGK